MRKEIRMNVKTSFQEFAFKWRAEQAFYENSNVNLITSYWFVDILIRIVLLEQSLDSTVRFTEFDDGNEIITFESFLTAFEATFVFWGSWGNSRNWLELKIEPPKANLACPYWWNAL